MKDSIKTIIYPVAHLAKAKTLYAKLAGVKPVMDEPYYVQFNVGQQQIGLDPNGHKQGMKGPVPYWQVDDINAMMATLISAGARELQAVKDVGGGKLIGSVTDADGNVIGLSQN